jgi:hypothetical protein
MNAAASGQGYDGTANTGGGGGGNDGNDRTVAGRGGSGVVILRHASTLPTAKTTGVVTITNPTGYTVYKFTENGSITF